MLDSYFDQWQFKNVLAAKIARQMGIKVIAMTGKTGVTLAAHYDILLNVPSDITMHIQKCHIALGHADYRTGRRAGRWAIKIFKKARQKKMKIVVVGTGYVGLVSGACFFRNLALM